MKTIGYILKSARAKKRYSLGKLEEITKIKGSFISLIEEEKWDKLPPFSTVLGFVKSVSATLDIEEKMAVAVLKRDYPPKRLSINTKPDVSSKFNWGPRATFILGIGAALAIIFGYLIFQYMRFISPPGLKIESPKDNQIVTGNSVLVFGTTDLDVKVTVNNQPVLIDAEGKFSV